MRKFLIGLLLVVFISVAGYLYYEVNRPSLDILTKFEVKVSMHSEKQEKDIQTDKNGESEENNYCYIWGPFSDAKLSEITSALKSSKLFEKVMVVDRFQEDRFIVYLGPYDTPTAAKAFVKQFRQQGYKKVKAILRGSLSYGVEIASFATESEANAYLVAGKAPMVKGIKVVKRLGEPTDDVDLTLKGLTNEETEIFLKLQKKFPSGRVMDCGLR